MITLTLLHPLQSTPIQSWTFEHESLIRIGRSTENHVVLYSAVVSRHHVDIQQQGDTWEVVGKGTNGTYIDGQRISQVPVTNGMVIRLARSGPLLQIHLGPDGPQVDSLSAVDQPPDHSVPPPPAEAASFVVDESPQGPSSLLEVGQDELQWFDPEGTVLAEQEPAELEALRESLKESPRQEPLQEPTEASLSPPPSTSYCAQSPTGLHRRRGLLFCLDCGHPLQSLGRAGDYQLLKLQHQDSVLLTYLAWRDGRTYAATTLTPTGGQDPQVRHLFAEEAMTYQHLHHPGLPRFIDFLNDGSLLYLITEMTYGPSLTDYVASHGPVPPAQAILWGLEVCAILGYLHSQIPPYLHLGIHPHRLLRHGTLRGSHSLVLSSLQGIRAFALGLELPVDPAGYSAPEQVQGQAGPAADWYALGATLIFLLTGKDPITFLPRSPGRQDIPSLPQLPGVSASMHNVLAQMIHPRPEARFPSAEVVAMALRSC